MAFEKGSVAVWPVGIRKGEWWSWLLTHCLVEPRKGLVVHCVVACAEENAEVALAEGGPEVVDVVYGCVSAVI